ncbi:MAG: hypothetical protein ACK56W_18795 [Pirellula sp.]|jgi:hypothetical protein|nr:hypothetical protein [Pirellula sp.]
MKSFRLVLSVFSTWIGECATHRAFAQQDAIRATPKVVLGQPALNPKDAVYRQVRGLFQNELNVIYTVCEPDAVRSQQLVNTVEEQWLIKSRREVAKRFAPHVYGTVDLDGLVERTMQTWVSELLTKEQASLYDAELADRMTYRRRALISKMLIWLQQKLQLSADQMDKVQEVLEAKWKDRWFRSIEATFDNESLFPEVNPSWLDTILTSAQRNALAIRVPQSRIAAVSQEYPSLDLNTPFRIGDIESSTQVKLDLEDDKPKPPVLER